MITKYHNRKIKLSSMFAFFLCVTFGLGNIGQTLAFYSDSETSLNNRFNAAQLDFRLTNPLLEEPIGPEVLGEVTHGSVVMPEEGSLAMQYDVAVAVSASSDTGFCDALVLEAKKNGVTTHDGSFTSFGLSPSTVFGSWEFGFDLPPTLPENAPAQGDVCDADIVYSAWRADVPTSEESGYTDEERLHVNFTARMVVLNEIYPSPNSVTAPKDREYIELFNNGSTPVDTLGWKLSEIAGASEVFYTVVSNGALSGEMQPFNGASTVIASGDTLVLEFGGGTSHLNNTGDTVRLYDVAGVLQDDHAYPNTVAGKSHVRYPDGIGLWVDPEPTPGEPNEVSVEDMRAQGFSENTIALLFELSKLRDSQIIDKENIDTLATTTEEVVGVIPNIELPEKTDTVASTTTEINIPQKMFVSTATATSTSDLGTTSKKRMVFASDLVPPTTDPSEETSVIEPTNASEGSVVALEELSEIRVEDVIDTSTKIEETPETDETLFVEVKEFGKPEEVEVLSETPEIHTE